MYPSPVGVAQFAGGETIRMSFWQPIGKPWRFDDIRQWFCQIIGDERGRASTRAADTEALNRKIAAARAIANDPGIGLEEADNARKGAERLEKKRLAAKKRAQTEVLNAFSAKYGRVYPPAADLVSFHIEHNGERIDPAAAPSKAIRAPRLRKNVAAIIPVPSSIKIESETIPIVDLMREMERRLGDAFLDTKAWQRVRARATRLVA